MSVRGQAGLSACLQISDQCVAPMQRRGQLFNMPLHQLCAAPLEIFEDTFEHAVEHAFEHTVNDAVEVV